MLPEPKNYDDLRGMVLFAYLKAEEKYKNALFRLSDKRPNTIIKVLEAEKTYLSFQDVYLTVLGL